MSSSPRSVGWPTQLGALVVVFIIAIPFLWMVSTSLKPPAEISLRDPTLIPNQPDLDNYVRVLVDAQFGRYFVNTLLVTTATTVISVAFATLAGWTPLPGSSCAPASRCCWASSPPRCFRASCWRFRCMSCCRRSA